MTEPSLPELEAERDRLYAQLARSVISAAGRSARTTASAGSRTARARSRVILATGRGSCGPGPPGGAALLAGSWPPARWRRCAGRSAGMRSSRRSASRSRR